MIRTAAGVALLLTSFTVAAQSGAVSGSFGVAGPTTQGSTVFVLPNVSRVCPIDMHASQGVWDRTIRVREGEQERVHSRYGQRISLSLKQTHSARIVSATVRVHGLNGTNRVLPTPAELSRNHSNAVATLKVKFVEENDGSVSADLWINGFTAVNSVELLDVSYADGSTWRNSGSGLCRVQPDPMMLITER